jgi:hypothetical protein
MAKEKVQEAGAMAASRREMYKAVVVKVMVPQQDASAVTGMGRGHHLEDRGVLVGAQ